LKKIIKNREPKFLIEYKNKFSKEELKNFDLYNDFPYKTKENCEKDEKNLRKILLDEQGYICCYCMSRINCENSKIEHFKPQSKYKELQLDYKNLFIVCKGGEGSKEQFCDTKKGNSELSKIELLKDIENFIYYKKSANYIEIYSNDSEINSDLNEILNLNVSILKSNRKEKWDEILKKLKEKNFDNNFIKKTLNYFKNRNKKGQYAEFCEMIVYFLQKINRKKRI
jgi:uncharacterized protein (TIGR02646 family)